jgi:hypothetical protein
LPIDLLWFSAVLNDAVVDLSWSTLSETGNDYFTVERSTELVSWEVVDVVKGAGYSREKLLYTSIDEFPISPVSYYRLKQTDFDGKFDYSKIVSMSSSGLLIEKVYPQPASDQLMIQLKEEVDDIRIYNATGSVVYSENVLLNNFLIIDTSRLPSGIYFVTASGKEYTTTLKMVVKN